MLKLLIASGLLFSSASFAMDAADHVMMTPKEIKWVDGPPSLPPGVKASILYGDPAAEGPFAMRLKLPSKYQVPPHTHPQDENVTVISGTLMMATGSDTKVKMMTLPAGSFARMKIGTQHFVRVEKETILQLNGMGPWGITYVNPADDPRNKK
jgi:quercetin dioxygenase-like cupin family protein